MNSSIPAADRRILVVGAGSIGTRHLTNLRELGAQYLAVCDPDSNRLESAQTADVQLFCNLDDAIEKFQPHIAFICTPPHLHVSQGMESVLAGCDVFVEKPFASSLSGTDELLAEITGRAAISMTGCNMRFHPGPAMLKRLIVQGAIGEPITANIYAGSYLPRWRIDHNYKQSYSSNAALGGGAILDCIHEIDLALWFFGPVREIAAMLIPGDSLEIEVEGGAQIIACHSNNIISQISLNFIQHDYRRHCQIIGSRGTLCWDFEFPLVRLFDGESRDWRIFELPPEWDINQMYIDEIIYFLNCVERSQQTFCTAAEGVMAVRVALATKESASQRKFVSPSQTCG